MRYSLGKDLTTLGSLGNNIGAPKYKLFTESVKKEVEELGKLMEERISSVAQRISEEKEKYLTKANSNKKVKPAYDLGTIVFLKDFSVPKSGRASKFRPRFLKSPNIVVSSSATFGIETARGLILGGQAKSVLVVNPEICTAHLNFRDRDSHFIFGDVATAILVEAETIAPKTHWEIIGSKLITEFSNNIRNNFGFLNRCEISDQGRQGNRRTDENAEKTRLSRSGLDDKLFVQNGRSVFKEVVPLVAQLITQQCAANGLNPHELKRMWLHQANLNMNVLIAKKVLGKDVTLEQAPVVLDEYANTSSAGSIIAFHKHSSDFTAGETGLICSFGAGYSAGAIFVRKVG